jgi:hypothetical protein
MNTEMIHIVPMIFAGFSLVWGANTMQIPTSG